MKILYLISSTELGGAEKALKDLVLETAKNHQVRVVCLRPVGEIGLFLQQKGIEVFSLNLRKKGWPGLAIKQIQKQLDLFKPDVVHALLYWAIELARVATAGRQIKLLSTPHFDFSKRPLYQRILDFLLKERDFLTIAESFSTAQYLISHQKYRKNKVYFLPNSVSKQQFFKDISLRNSMRQKHNFQPEEVVFITVMRLVPVKNPLLLLQAFRNVVRTNPHARLVVVGDGPERAKMESFIKEGGLTPYVLLAGVQEEVNAWLNMADVFVLPSREESLPLALLEALQVGLPCVVSAVGDMPKRVEHGKNGFVCPPQDITLLSCFLAELAQQPELRQKQGAFSLEQANQFPNAYLQYQHLYTQIEQGEFSHENSAKTTQNNN